LIELLVAMVVLAIIMTLLLSVTNIVSRTWKGVSDKMQSFEGARYAFGRISANLGQAVLNTYWDYDDATAPTAYERQSELQFLSLPMKKISSLFPSGRYPNTHGLFFQAPTGRVANKASYSHLPQLLNAFGYFVEYGDDSSDRPSFLPTTVLPRYRYRLKEWCVPAEEFSLYAATSGVSGKNYLGDQTLQWMDFTKTGASTLAENVVAFIVHPKNTEDINLKASALTDDYYYDSRNDGKSPLALSQRHQLPPEVEIVMIAIDEASANRVFKNASTPPDITDGLFEDPARLETDLGALTDKLTRQNIRFVVLRSTVKIRGARWNQN